MKTPFSSLQPPARTRKRVLFVAPAPSTFTGGPSSNTRNFMASDAFRTNDVRLVDIAPPPAPYSTVIRSIHSIRLFARLLRALVEHRPSAAYLMTGSYTGFYEKAIMALVCRALGTGTVLHLIGGGFEDFVRSSPFHARAVPWLLARTSVVGCVGTRWLDYVHGISPRANARLLPNPVDVAAVQCVATRARSRDDRDVRFLFVGVMTTIKGPFDLLDACARARGSLEGRARLTLVGSGPSLDEVRRRIRDLGLEAFVSAPGFVSDEDKARYLAEADAFVLPSHAEGIPVALLEAMAAGLPVIATPVGAVRDAVDETCGVLVTPQAPDELAVALVRMVEAGAKRLEMGAQAHAIVCGRYDVSVVGEALDRLLEEAAGIRRDGGGA